MSIQNRVAQCFRVLQSALLCIGFLSLACTNSKSIKVSTPSTTGSGPASLEGKWTVAGTPRKSLAILPSCKPVSVGAVFQFTGEKLEVFLPNGKTPCGVFGVRSTPGTLSLIREDMVWLVNYELNANTLTLKSTAFFTTDSNDTIPSPNDQAAASGEVVVTLIKN